MAMEVNGAAILTAIIKSPGAFGMNEAQINMLALHTLLTKIKDKIVDLTILRSMAQMTGLHDFPLALDHLTEKDLLAVAKRLDPKNPAFKTEGQSWARGQILKLVQGSAEPFIPPSKAAPSAPKASAPKAKPPKTGMAMKSKALKARGSTGTKAKLT